MMKTILFSFSLLFMSFNSAAAEVPAAVSELLASYQQQGDAQRGQTLWQQQHTVKQQQRSCGSCHGDDLSQAGKHQKTGKLIEPMAFSTNPSRYQDKKKIKKWLKRNCKWTLQRECSATEKADLLQYLIQQ